VECAGRLCSSSWDGSIRIWNAATLAHEACLRAPGAAGVDTLAAWEGRLVSGHADGSLLVWDMLSGACEQALEGHALFVDSLAVCGSRLASGSGDRTIRLWAMGPAAPWPCERTLTGHAGWVVALAAWRGKVLSGSSDSTVRVWDAATGAHDATLAGHGLTVNGLAVVGDRVWSSSLDGTVREWAAGAWAALRTVDVCGGDAALRPRCLAVSGGQLVCGSGALSVWDLATMAGERALRQPAGDAVQALVAVGAQVWAGVGNKVVVWGSR
jgi:WD40 repeat protein